MIKHSNADDGLWHWNPPLYRAMKHSLIPIWSAKYFDWTCWEDDWILWTKQQEFRLHDRMSKTNHKELIKEMG